ncbi:MAG: peptide chain release factor N(5)-glutamine methyltransferase [Candidatus Omnitrophica bacterium]|nr:peptide chain release factor N(5)-glutamine methyltransferase [Candidatus Omnitrophota bacterium]
MIALASTLLEIQERLQAAGLAAREARTDAEWMLCELSGCTRASLYTHFPKLSEAQQAQLDHWVQQRSERRPLQYVLGRATFRDLDLEVNEAVLVPRPETEQLVDLVLEIYAPGRAGALKIADVGTGSGALGLSLTKIYGNCRMFCLEISPAALEVARRNAAREGLSRRISFLEGDLLQPLETVHCADPAGKLDLIVSNPPYLTTAEWVCAAPELHFEPRVALDAGEDGLNALRRLVAEAPAFLKPGAWLLLEIGCDQGAALLAWAKQFSDWSRVRVQRDWAGRDRFFLAQNQA